MNMHTYTYAKSSSNERIVLLRDVKDTLHLSYFRLLDAYSWQRNCFELIFRGDKAKLPRQTPSPKLLQHY